MLTGRPAMVRPHHPALPSLPSLCPATPELGHAGDETRLHLSVGTLQAQRREGRTQAPKGLGAGEQGGFHIGLSEASSGALVHLSATGQSSPFPQQL